MLYDKYDIYEERPYYKKTCIVCGKQFTARRTDAVCCSGKCCHKNPLRKPKQNGSIRKTCVICGKEFTVNKSRYNSDGISYCSMKCRKELLLQKACNTNHSSSTIQKICPQCGKEFFTKSRKAAEQVYCSRECANRNRHISVIQMEIFDIVKELVDQDAVCEKEWDWLINIDTGKRMRVDIFCPSINLAIEYDGRHHYNPIAFNLGEEGLAKVKDRDAKKERLLSENGIRLVRFSGRISEKVLEQIKSLV